MNKNSRSYLFCNPPKTDFSGSFAVVFLKNDQLFRMNEIKIQIFLEVGFGLESGCKSGRVRVGLNEYFFSGSGSSRVGGGGIFRVRVGLEKSPTRSILETLWIINKIWYFLFRSILMTKENRLWNVIQLIFFVI